MRPSVFLDETETFPDSYETETFQNSVSKPSRNRLETETLRPTVHAWIFDCKTNNSFYKT